MHTEKIHIPKFGHICGCQLTATWCPGDLHYFCILEMTESQPPISDVSLSIFIEIRDRFRKQHNKSKQLRIIFCDQEDYWELVPVWSSGILTALEKSDIQKEALIRIGFLKNPIYP